MVSPMARRALAAVALLVGMVAPGGVAAARRLPEDPVGGAQRALQAAVPQTSCRSVVHIGDSLSVGLESSSMIPDPSMRIDARYEQVGATEVRLEISGARSVIEHIDDQEGGERVAQRLRRNGFHGCWVIALGTNDAANVDAGSAYGYRERIDRMMAIIGDDPVLWVDTVTRKSGGHYASEHMRLFNQALVKAHARYPTLRAYQWSEEAQEQWFAGDGLHYTAGGYAYRAALIAGALAAEFPA